MQLKTLREYFALGVIRSFRAERVAMGNGWTLAVIGREAGQLWQLATATGPVREFSSLDTLVRVVEDVTGKDVSQLVFG